MNLKYLGVLALTQPGIKEAVSGATNTRDGKAEQITDKSHCFHPYCNGGEGKKQDGKYKTDSRCAYGSH